MRALTLLLCAATAAGCVAPRDASTGNYRPPTQDELRVPYIVTGPPTALPPSETTPVAIPDDPKAPTSNVGEGWTVGCNQDRVTLDYSCFATKWYGREHRLRIHYDHVLGYCFSAAMNNHPGRQAVIRVGTNAPIWYERMMVCGEQAETITNQLLTASGGAARGNIWPNRTEEFEFDTAGFEHAYRALRARVANLPARTR